VPGGTSAVAPSDPNQPPQETGQQPTSGPAPVQEQEPIFVAGEERTEEGLPVIPQPPYTPLVSGPGYAAALAYSFVSQGGFDATIDGGEFSSFEINDAVFDAQGRLTSLTGNSGSTFALNGQHAEFGSDGILAWGRWTGQVNFIDGGEGIVIPETYDANQGFHYVVGMPTASMPTIGTATYSLMGATSPTYADGRTAPGTFTGSLGVTFGGSASVTGNFQVSMPDGKGWTWGIDTSTATGSPFFSQNVSDFSSPGIQGIGGACGFTCSCSASVTGFFAGTTAERAGMSYGIRDSSNGPSGSDVVGAAAFKQN
jgi:hypothetical protein